MRNKGKIIAILLISIMVAALVISCDDPTANLSARQLGEIAFEGMNIGSYAYLIQNEINFDGDMRDAPPPAIGTHTINRVDLFDLIDDAEEAEAAGIAKGQAVLLRGSIVVTETTYKMTGSFRFRNYLDFPDGTFHIVAEVSTDDESDIEPIITVNGRPADIQ